MLGSGNWLPLIVGIQLPTDAASYTRRMESSYIFPSLQFPGWPWGTPSHLPHGKGSFCRMKLPQAWNQLLCMTSSFCCSVNEIFTLLGLYAASQHRLVGSYILQQPVCSNLMVTHWRLLDPCRWDWQVVTKMSVTNYQSMLRNIPEERRYQADYLRHCSTEIKLYLQSTTHFQSRWLLKPRDDCTFPYINLFHSAITNVSSSL
jgi:hypothetical protein